MITGSHKCIQFLSRAAHTGADCTRYPYCGRLKNIVKHFKICQEGVKNNCRVCITFMDLIRIHKKKCQLDNQETCCLTYCKHLTTKLQSEQEHLKVRNALIKSRQNPGKSSQNPGKSTAMEATQSTEAQSTLDIVKQIQSKLRKEREEEKCIEDILDNYRINVIIPSVRSPVDEMVRFEDPRSLESLQSLEHSSRCIFGTCSVSCRRMKNVILHTVSCLPDTVGPTACLVCSTFIQLCLAHAKKCQDSDCPIYLCLNIRRVASSLLGEDDVGQQLSSPEINLVKGWLSNPCRHSNTENNGPRHNVERSAEEMEIAELIRNVRGSDYIDRLSREYHVNRREGGQGRSSNVETRGERQELEAVDPAAILAPSSASSHRPHSYSNPFTQSGREARDDGLLERLSRRRDEPPSISTRHILTIDSNLWDFGVDPYLARLMEPRLTSNQYDGYIALLSRSVRDQQLRLIQRLKDLERRVCGVRRDISRASAPPSVAGSTD